MPANGSPGEGVAEKQMNSLRARIARLRDARSTLNPKLLAIADELAKENVGRRVEVDASEAKEPT